jgi:hypothetical protein
MQHAPVWWVQILLSAVIGVVLGALLTQIGRLGIAALKGRKVSITGTWHAYVYTFKQDYECIDYTMEIQKGRLGGTNVIVLNNGKIAYKGVVYDERGHLIFELNATARDQRETICQRYVGPVGEKDKLLGLWLSYDYHTHVASGVVILSQTKLPPFELRKILKRHYDINVDHAMIKIM